MPADESPGAGLCTTTWTNHCMQVTFEKGGGALHGLLSLTESNTRETPKCEWSTANTAAASAYPTFIYQVHFCHNKYICEGLFRLSV